MYKPNFILVGIDDVPLEPTKEYVVRMQQSGNYEAIEDILMAQFKSLTSEELSNDNYDDGKAFIPA